MTQLANKVPSLIVIVMFSGCGMTNREEPAMMAIAFRNGLIEGISQDGLIHYFEPSSLKEKSVERKSISPHNGMWASAFSLDGNFLSVTEKNNVVRAGSVDGRLEVVTEETSSVIGLALASSASSIAVLTDDDVITIYRERKAVTTIRGGNDHFSSKAMAFSPDTKVLAVGLLNLDGPPSPTIRLYNVEDGSLLKSLGPTGVITALAFSPLGNSLAFAGSPGKSPNDPTFVEIWNIQDGTRVAEWKDSKPYQGIRSLAFDGSSVVCSPNRGPLRAFNLNEGRLSPR